MNVNNQAISTYSGWNFNSIAAFNGTLLGATSSGIYPIGGTSDNGVDIAATILSGSMDFGDSFIKHLRDVWFIFRADGVLRLAVWVNEETSTEIHKDTTITGTNIDEERLKIPRGLRGRFFTIKITNIDGADFDLHQISMLVESIKMKVR